MTYNMSLSEAVTNVAYFWNCKRKYVESIYHCACRGSGDGGGVVSKRVSERDPLKYDNQKINRGDRRLICHGRCYNVITTNVIKPIK